MPTLAGYQLRDPIFRDEHVTVYRGTLYRGARAKTSSNETTPNQTARDEVAPGEIAPGEIAVIVKLLHDEYPSLEQLACLRHEYETTRTLSLEGVARPLTLEPMGNGLALIWEDSGAQSLDFFLRDNTVDVPLFLCLAIETAEIVGQLHRNNVVHHDIKPRHVLVHPQTHRVQLTGFDSATLLHQTPPQTAPQTTSETQSSTRLLSQKPDTTPQNASLNGARSNTNPQNTTPPNVAPNTTPLRGTLAYMSPEQTGRTSHDVDFRTDFYSLGALFYEMLTGNAPFQSDDPLEILHAHLARPPLSPHEINPNVPLPIAQIVLKLLAKTPDERYASAHGLKADLQRCLESWRRQVKVELFELGAQDFSGELRLSPRLYGRESEIETLREAFERVRRGAREWVLVSGFSGVGKSSLVREIQDSVLRQGGFFVSGKFDQFRRDAPFAAIVKAFRELIAHLLTENENVLSRWKTELQNALGESGQIAVDVIPELERIVGAQPSAPELGPLETQNRFQLVMANLIRVFAGASHPLVLFLDDLQWADAASLKLLRVLESDAPQFLLILCALRDNETDSSHPALLQWNELQSGGATMQTLQLRALELPHVAQLVADALRCQPEHASPLAHLLWLKTGGNPFFVGQMLQLLWREKLLWFDHDDARWNWDLARIRDQAISDHIVELMAAKIASMSLETQQTLRLAACIGNAFNLQTLAVVGGKNQSETSSHIWEALREGLLLPLESDFDGFRFAHDRVQQAAHSMLQDEERRQLHLQIGRLLLQAEENAPHDDKQSRDNRRDELLFDIAGHFNCALDLIDEPTQRRAVLELNLRAGRKAKSATAYESALEYFGVAIGLLGENAWNDDYETAFALHKERAECEFLAGNIAVAQELFALLNARAVRVLDRAEVVRLHIQLCTILNDFTQAIDVGLRGLAQLGVKLPNEPSQVVILRHVLQVRKTRGRRTIASLADAPHLKDAHQKAILDVLSNMVAPLYVSGRQNLFTLVVLKMTELSLRWGNSDVSAQAYALYGVILGRLWATSKAATNWAKPRCNCASSSAMRDRKAKPTSRFRLFSALGASLWLLAKAIFGAPTNWDWRLATRFSPVMPW